MFTSVTLLFKYRSFYEIMWKNMVQYRTVLALCMLDK